MVAHVQENQFDLGNTDLKEDNVQTQIARAMFQVYEPIVLTGYGSPELQTICKQLGLSEHRMSYYAVRAAALGPVVVSATFYHHTPEIVSPAIPEHSGLEQVGTFRIKLPTGTFDNV